MAHQVEDGVDTAHLAEEVVELADGDAVLGMLLRRPPVSFPQLTDITQLGSWRRFVSRESTKDTRAEVTP
ncbi:hypothetical protein ACFQ1S_19910 [Kibdelosporangium lantanae]|uniref:Uncharacterized protein n=1 Tax=Kibdelosporangium lantanae TaxID=1497396 RepID=A0ABW3MA54_9PSEU